MTSAMHLSPTIYFQNSKYYDVEYSNIVILSDLPLLEEKTIMAQQS
jgi:hypothetical protein